MNPLADSQRVLLLQVFIVIWQCIKNPTVMSFDYLNHSREMQKAEEAGRNDSYYSPPGGDPLLAMAYQRKYDDAKAARIPARPDPVGSAIMTFLGYLLLFSITIGPLACAKFSDFWGQFSSTVQIIFILLALVWVIACIYFYVEILPKIKAAANRFIDRVFINPKTKKVHLGIRIIFWISCVFAFFYLFLVFTN